MNGIHAIIEANGRLAHLSANELVSLMEASANAAGAQILNSHIHEFGEEQGNTGVVLLAESHISVHTWPEKNYAAFDIFMCGEPNLNKAIDILKQANGNGDLFVKTLQRGRERPQTLNPADLAKNLLSDNPLLAEKIEPHILSLDSDVASALEETIKFMLLCSKFEQVLTPSTLVDAVWHEFLLFTRAYENFCQQHLTHFIHHQPSNNKAQESIQYQTTISLYLREFGTPNSAYWNNNGLCTSHCGPCESKE